MKQIIDFSTYLSCKLYETTGFKMISSDIMVFLLTKNGMMRAIQTEDSEVAEAMRSSLQFGSEFNMDLVKHMIPLIDCLTGDFLGDCEAYGYPVSKPYKDLTELEYDKVHATQPTVSQVINPGNSLHILKDRDVVKHQVVITTPTPLPYDDVVTITGFSKQAGELEYVKDTQLRGTLKVPAGFAGSLSLTVNKSGLQNHIKYQATSTFNRGLTASVTSVT